MKSSFQDHIIIRCLCCGQKNRIPPHRLHDKPICGRCGARMDEFVIVCLKCGTKNRVQESRFNDRPICGKCKSPLYSGRIAEVSDDTFESEVIMFPAPVLVCFWSPDCASCKVVIAYLEKIASRYAGGIKIAKLNTKKNGVTTEKYAIGGIPAFLFFKNGTVADKITGVATKEEIEIRLKSVMAEKPKENNK